MKQVISRKIGISRRIDANGRYVIPSELRKLYQIGENDILEAIPEAEGILIRKVGYTMQVVPVNGESADKI